MKPYPILKDQTIAGIFEWLKYVVRARTDDIREFENLENIFVYGRKVGKIPSASNNVVADDKVGDFNVTATYAYYLIDNAGTAEWRRVAVGSF